MIDLKIQAKNCKCFGDDPQGIERILPVNIIVGKNNSGKSALLDIVEYAINPSAISLVGHQNKKPEVFLTEKITQAQVESVFSVTTSGGGIPGMHHFAYGIQWLDKPLTIKRANQNEFVKVDPPFDISQEVVSQYRFDKELARVFSNPIEGKKFRRLAAERNIVPEGESNIQLLPGGEGATNLIQTFINKATMRKRPVVEVELLNALNKIFSPEAKFERIHLQKLDDGRWEIYLEETGKGSPISLSDSGSGLKTVILVLVNLLLFPKLDDTPLERFMFAFEELENNLHPSIQRKLLLFIRETAIKEKCTFFITTHSNVIIDLFSRDEEAQIIHIKNNGVVATAKTVQTHLDSGGVLDDLDFRASDLLQSNGVVWVEGPSDRTYFNRWIELWTDGQLKEGVHYQCLFYGGRLLAHFTASPEELNEAIPVLKINRNMILLMDSDKDSADEDINSTKERLKKEIESINALCWITAGREVENYIPHEAILAYYEKTTLPKLKEFKKFADYLNKSVEKGEGNRFLDKKVLYAERIAPLFTKSMLEQHLDLKEKIEQACARIKDWNKLS